MSMTLLSMVQNILSAMDSDEVNSITDTTESLQVAEVIKETYEEQFNNIQIPLFKGLVKLDGISDVTKPNYMLVPEGVDSFEWIRYRNDRNNSRFDPVTFVSAEDFLQTAYEYTSSSDNVFLTTDPGSGIQYYVKSNKSPSFYTMFDDKYIAFDSYDLDYDSTLQQSKSAAFGTKRNNFLLEDDFIPILPDNLFPLLLSESKSVCFYNFKQVQSGKEEQRARRQRIRMQNNQFKSTRNQKRSIADKNNYARNR